MSERRISLALWILGVILAFVLPGACWRPAPAEPPRPIKISRQAYAKWKALEARHKALKAKCEERVRHARTIEQAACAAQVQACQIQINQGLRAILEASRKRCPPVRSCTVPWVISGAVAGACVAGVIAVGVAK